MGRAGPGRASNRPQVARAGGGRPRRARSGLPAVSISSARRIRRPSRHGSVCRPGSRHGLAGRALGRPAEERNRPYPVARTQPSRRRNAGGMQSPSPAPHGPALRRAERGRGSGRGPTPDGRLRVCAPCRRALARLPRAGARATRAGARAAAVLAGVAGPPYTVRRCDSKRGFHSSYVGVRSVRRDRDREEVRLALLALCRSAAVLADGESSTFFAM